jgi:hypothetical protein
MVLNYVIENEVGQKKSPLFASIWWLQNIDRSDTRQNT